MGSARRLVYGLLVAAAAASLVACLPTPQQHPPPHPPPPKPAPKPAAPAHHWPHLHMPHPHMPHPHMPHLPDSVKAKLHKVKTCITSELPKLPGGIAKILGGCLPAAATGVPGFAACAASKGAMSAARATQHFAVCVG